MEPCSASVAIGPVSSSLNAHQQLDDVACIVVQEDGEPVGIGIPADDWLQGDDNRAFDHKVYILSTPFGLDLLDRARAAVVSDADRLIDMLELAPRPRDRLDDRICVGIALTYPTYSVLSAAVIDHGSAGFRVDGLAALGDDGTVCWG